MGYSLVEELDAVRWNLGLGIKRILIDCRVFVGQIDLIVVGKEYFFVCVGHLLG